MNYQLEYGSDRLEMHTDSLERGEKVLLVDDLIATGGTASASIKLIEQLGGKVLEVGFIVDLPDLGAVHYCVIWDIKLSHCVSLRAISQQSVLNDED